MAIFTVTKDSLSRTLAKAAEKKNLSLAPHVVPTLVEGILSYYPNHAGESARWGEYKLDITVESLWDILNNIPASMGLVPLSPSTVDKMVTEVFETYMTAPAKIVGYGIKDLVTGNFIFPCTCKTEAAARKLKASHFPATQYVIVKLAEAGQVGGYRGADAGGYHG